MWIFKSQDSTHIAIHMCIHVYGNLLTALSLMQVGRGI